MPRVPVSLAALGLCAAVAGSARPAAADDGAGGYRIAQLILQQKIVVRVQRFALPRQVEWQEKKGPKCVPVDGMAGAMIVQANAVDLVLAGGQRVRARLDKDCSALNFYSGFYLKPSRDGKVCAERDAVHSRSGRTCEIDGFRRLVAKR